MRFGFECSYDSAIWLSVALMAGVVLGMGAMGLALIGSRFARWLGMATLAMGAAVVAAGALAPSGVLPSGSDPVAPDVKQMLADQEARSDAASTPLQRANRARWAKENDANMRSECVYAGLQWSVVPLLLGAAALGIAFARSRATRDPSYDAR